MTTKQDIKELLQEIEKIVCDGLELGIRVERISPEDLVLMTVEMLAYRKRSIRRATNVIDFVKKRKEKLCFTESNYPQQE